jgi:hypothetical protein
MANADTEVTLFQLQQAMCSSIAAEFPVFKTVEFMRIEEAENLETPACLIEMTEFEEAPGDDSGTGQFPALVRFELRVIGSSQSANAKLVIRNQVIALARWLYRRRFTGVPSDPVAGINAMPDSFSPRADRFEIWVIEMALLAMFGASVWDDDGTVPNALYSFAPDIGAANVDKYIPLDNEGPAQ